MKCADLNRYTFSLLNIEERYTCSFKSAHFSFLHPSILSSISIKRNLDSSQPRFSICKKKLKCSVKPYYINFVNINKIWMKNYLWVIKLDEIKNPTYHWNSNKIICLFKQLQVESHNFFCNVEKVYVSYYPESVIFNSRNELYGFCKHKEKYLLLNSWYPFTLLHFLFSFHFSNLNM